jgi:hypothetical protein
MDHVMAIDACDVNPRTALDIARCPSIERMDPMTCTFVLHAQENERFAPGCFDDSVGDTVPIIDGRFAETGVIVSVDVQPDGRSAHIRYARTGQGS